VLVVSFKEIIQSLGFRIAYFYSIIFPKAIGKVTDSVFLVSFPTCKVTKKTILVPLPTYKVTKKTILVPLPTYKVTKKTILVPLPT